MTTPRHLVGMGGGGFAMESDNTLLDDYVLGLSRRSPPRLCFIPTASGDSSDFIVKFYRSFRGRAVLDDLTLFGTALRARRPLATSELERFVLEQDVLYVGGGNTANMLAVWRVHGLDRVLRTAWESGVVLAGLSAGLLCWFEASLSDSYGGQEALHDGLGFLSGSACPHYAATTGRRPAYHRAIEAGLPEGYGVDDYAALHYEGTRLATVVSSKPDATAYRVTTAQGATEERLPARYLGARLSIGSMKSLPG